MTGCSNEQIRRQFWSKKLSISKKYNYTWPWYFQLSPLPSVLSQLCLVKVPPLFVTLMKSGTFAKFINMTFCIECQKFSLEVELLKLFLLFSATKLNLHPQNVLHHFTLIAASSTAGLNSKHDLSVIDEMQKSPIEKRKRNLKTISPHSRGEREI